MSQFRLKMTNSYFKNVYKSERVCKGNWRLDCATLSLMPDDCVTLVVLWKPAHIHWSVQYFCTGEMSTVLIILCYLNTFSPHNLGQWLSREELYCRGMMQRIVTVFGHAMK